MVMLRNLLVVCSRAALLAAVFACRSASPEQRAPQTPPSQTTAAPDTSPAAEPARSPVPPDAGVPVQPLTPSAKTEAPTCPPRTQPAKCPATEPNVNRPCSPKGIECTYAP